MSTWIFLRGLTRESRHWGDFPAAFRSEVADADVVTLDLPGNGNLNHLQSPTSVDAMAEYCRSEMAARGIRPPYHVLAMSLGAMVAVAWAQRHPDEIRCGVLINTSLRSAGSFYQRLRPQNYAVLVKLAVFGGSDEEWESTILRITSRRTDTASLLSSWIALRRSHAVSRANALRQLLAAIRYRAPEHVAMPMLILGSTEDRLVNVRCSRRIALRWKCAFAEHPGAGHDIPLDDGAWVAQQVSAWLCDRLLIDVNQ